MLVSMHRIAHCVLGTGLPVRHVYTLSHHVEICYTRPFPAAMSLAVLQQQVGAVLWHVVHKLVGRGKIPIVGYQDC